jgi:glycosyltransferase involved in cell wall biosynthesis
MKTITLIHYAYPPHIGGVERLMSQQASILAGLGYTTRVLTGSGESSMNAVSLVQEPLLQALRNIRPDLQARIVQGSPMDDEFKALAAEIEKLLEKQLESTDVIIVHNMLTLIHNLPFSWAMKSYMQKHKDKKLIVWVHDQTFIDNGKVLMSKEGVTLHDELKTLLLTPIPTANYVVISEALGHLLAQVMNIEPTQMSVIPNGVHVRKFLEIDPAMWSLWETYKLATAFPIVLSPVNLLERKRVDYVLDIVSGLASSYPNIRYIISGKGSEHRDTSGYVQKIKEHIQSSGLEGNVIFAGEVVGRAMTDEEMHDLYSISDIVLYLSRQENFGLPILEAAMSKTPIWVSDLPVFREIGGESLTYIPEGQSASDAAMKLKDFLDHNSLVQLRKRVRTEYMLDRVIAEKLVPLIER